MQRVRLISGLVLVTLAIITAGCGDRDQETLELTGSSTVAPFVSDIAADFEAARDGVRVDVQTGGTSRGISDASRGTADFGMASRELREDEQDLVATPIARDGISLIVHSDNPVEALGKDQVRALFTAEVSEWQAITDYDADVTRVHKGDGRATLDVFLDYFELENRQVQADMVVGENQQGIRSVAGNRGAIGYVSIGAALHEQEQGASIRAVKMEGVAPDEDAVATGEYPLTRNLNLISADEPDGLAREFLEFIDSEAGRERIAQHFMVPVEEQAQ